MISLYRFCPIAEASYTTCLWLLNSGGNNYLICDESVRLPTSKEKNSLYLLWYFHFNEKRHNHKSTKNTLHKSYKFICICHWVKEIVGYWKHPEFWLPQISIKQSINYKHSWSQLFMSINRPSPQKQFIHSYLATTMGETKESVVSLCVDLCRTLAFCSPASSAFRIRRIGPMTRHIFFGCSCK